MPPRFFSLLVCYYAHKVSFAAAAAALADLSFDEFLHRLKEHFDVGFQVADEAVLEALQTVKRQRVSAVFSLYPAGEMAEGGKP
jgi:hypothetical protein